MVSITQKRYFLGVNFSTFAQAWSELVGQMFQLPVFDWFSPAVAVKVLRADGDQSTWQASRRLTLSRNSSQDTTRFVAVELPEALVLVRNLALVGVPASETPLAVELEAKANSPFVSGDLLWGYGKSRSTEGKDQICLVLASRKKVDAFIQEHSTHFQGKGLPEVWVVQGLTEPIVLPGFGESVRIRRQRLGRRVAFCLLFTASLLIAAICMTPSLQLYMRGVDAANAFVVERQSTKALAEKRAAYLASLEQLHELSELTANRVDPLVVMDQLTRIVPDDTNVLSMQVNGAKVAIAGQTNNAASLMQHLGSQTGVADVKAPVAAIRALGLSKDSYTIEFSLTPLSASVAQAPEAVLPLAASASAPVPSASTSSLAPTPAVSKPTAATSTRVP